MCEHKSDFLSKVVMQCRAIFLTGSVFKIVSTKSYINRLRLRYSQKSALLAHKLISRPESRENENYAWDVLLIFLLFYFSEPQQFSFIIRVFLASMNNFIKK